MKLSPDVTRCTKNKRRETVQTHVFHFSNFSVIASAVRPDDDVIHIGGTHTDSPHLSQKWSSLEEAIEKVSAKANDMEDKNRIHGTGYAGCKFGIFAHDPSCLRGPQRAELFKHLGQVLDFYGGRLYTGADVETDLFDLMVILQVCPWVLGKPLRYGGCDDPSKYTANAIVQIQKKIMPIIRPASPEFRGKRIAIKGAAGKVGRFIVMNLFREGANLAVADLNIDGIEEIRHAYPGVEPRHPDAIHMTHAPIFCPADTTVTIPNRLTVDQFRCDAIIGSANDQNRSSELEDLLFYRDKRILHPSINGALENGAGLLAVVNELKEGGFSQQALEANIEQLVQKTVDICSEAIQRNIPPYKIVEERYLK